MAKIIASIIFCVIVLAELAFAAEPLRNNPFLRSGNAQASTASSSDSSSVDLKLKAVLFDEVKPLANIGGDIVAVGDLVNGYTVDEVRKHEVLLLRNGRKTVLELDVTKNDDAHHAVLADRE